jgi:opacity protein-like surface antigen
MKKTILSAVAAGLLATSSYAASAPKYVSAGYAIQTVGEWDSGGALVFNAGAIIMGSLGAEFEYTTTIMSNEKTGSMEADLTTMGFYATYYADMGSMYMIPKIGMVNWTVDATSPDGSSSVDDTVLSYGVDISIPMGSFDLTVNYTQLDIDEEITNMGVNARFVF